MSRAVAAMTRPGPLATSLRRTLALLLAPALLAGCSLWEEEERLAGERVPVRSLPEQGEEGDRVIARPLPPAQAIEAWTQVAANAAHNAGHLAGPAEPARVWSADAGTGSSSDSFITAPPVVGGGLVFALDAAAGIRAVDAASGALRWETSLVPNEEEEGEEGFGGGLALDGGRLFATTGFGEVLALNPASGEVLWRRAFGAPFRAGPAAADGLVVAVSRASTAFALSAQTGEIVWRVQGVGAEAGFLGGASPAVGGGGAVLPFSSGELVAVDAVTGRRLWGAVITGGRRGLARASITDLTGDPVLVGPIVVSANQSGRIAALETRSGRRLWTREIGSTQPIWAAGETLFLVSDTAELMRLDAGTGETLWSRALPAFEDPDDREDPITYSGPVLVSGRLLVTDSLGNLWSVDARTGEGAPVAQVPDGSTTGPVVAGGTVYVLSEDAELHAYR
jgi:outer membrane protein assembly factor BamB